MYDYSDLSGVKGWKQDGTVETNICLWAKATGLGSCFAKGCCKLIRSSP